MTFTLIEFQANAADECVVEVRDETARDAELQGDQRQQEGRMFEQAAKLPASYETRWTNGKKAAVVHAVQSGVISLERALALYRMSAHEFESWRKACAPLDQPYAGLRHVHRVQHLSHGQYSYSAACSISDLGSCRMTPSSGSNSFSQGA